MHIGALKGVIRRRPVVRTSVRTSARAHAPAARPRARGRRARAGAGLARAPLAPRAPVSPGNFYLLVYFLYFI